MIIDNIEIEFVKIKLTRPYTIAYKTTSFINNMLSSNYFLDIKTKLIAIINNIPASYSIIILILVTILIRGI